MPFAKEFKGSKTFIYDTVPLEPYRLFYEPVGAGGKQSIDTNVVSSGLLCRPDQFIKVESIKCCLLQDGKPLPISSPHWQNTLFRFKVQHQCLTGPLLLFADPIAALVSEGFKSLDSAVASAVIDALCSRNKNDFYIRHYDHVECEVNPQSLDSSIRLRAVIDGVLWSEA